MTKTGTDNTDATVSDKLKAVLSVSSVPKDKVDDYVVYIVLPYSGLYSTKASIAS